MKRILRLALSLSLAVILMIFFPGCSQSKTRTGTPSYLTREDWAEDVRSALNTFIAVNGKDSDTYDDSVYVVLDFDNTTAIFDVEEQLAIYQLQHMAFAVSPEELEDVLSSGLSNPDEDLSFLGYGKGSYRDWIGDITAAYEKLVHRYGPFTPEGLSDEESAALLEDDDWREFSAKMRAMYDLVYDNESASVAYPWITYWFAGMTSDEIYNLASRSHQFFSGVETAKVTWKSPEDYESRVGTVEYTWTSGVQVTENMKELLRVLRENGISVWICSASYIDVIRAAVDYWGLHDSVSGVLAMTNKTADGKMLSQCDVDKAHGWMPVEGKEAWTEDTVPLNAQPQGPGKVEAIRNTLCTRYGHGPSAGFMDSTGDFNFCTEFSSLQLVVCFNRANRAVTDGGGLIAELAVYQKDTLHYDLNSASAAGDILYVLQGRDENGLRTFRSSNSTLRFGEQEEQLFAGENNEKQLQYMKEHKMSTKDILETFAVKTSAEDSGNLLGFAYGFLTEYAGYRSRS